MLRNWNVFGHIHQERIDRAVPDEGFYTLQQGVNQVARIPRSKDAWLEKLNAKRVALSVLRVGGAIVALEYGASAAMTETPFSFCAVERRAVLANTIQTKH